MPVQTYLEDALRNIDYDDLGNWVIPDSQLKEFNLTKKLYGYQVEAIKNAIKVFSVYFSENSGGKSGLYNLCLGYDMPKNELDVCEKNGQDINQRFIRLSKFFPIKKIKGKNFIEEFNFFNRVAFWMATASGKTVVLIKLIELIDFYQKQGMLPKNKIMILLPSEKLQRQFESVVKDYNTGKERKISLTSLKDYEERQNSPELELFNEIEVFIYRSDLLSDKQQIKRIDTGIYDNNGEWFIFMDEAHKGDKDDSIRQDYISIMSRNGFLFNFSATFTDTVDFDTTCFNFNLERFIEEGYGKNIYLSESTYKFKKKSDDFDETQKQLQVLKSFITFTLVKKSKKEGFYHNPLMVTLVDEINTIDADMDLFFAEIEKIAVGSIENGLFEKAKNELYNELVGHKEYQFGNEELKSESNDFKTALNSITIKDILECVYNSPSHGQIEVIEGEKGKEFALKLKTATAPFALFKMGDAATYVREKLNGNYLIITSFEEKHYFDSLNKPNGQNINLLIGSRTFYEGWDSNRPNVMNFINIGTGEAKKFVLQSLGRGVRIEPEKNNRKRLPYNNSNKNQLLETLFVFATNRKTVETILEVMKSQKVEETEIELVENNRIFDLIIPVYQDVKTSLPLSKFNLSKKSLEMLREYVASFSDGLLAVIFSLTPNMIEKLRLCLQPSKEKEIFKIDNNIVYKAYELLTKRFCLYLDSYAKVVNGFKELSDEIIHFKHIKISNNEWDSVGPVIKAFAEDESKKNIDDELTKLLNEFQSGNISQNEYLEKVKNATRTLSSTSLNKVKDLHLKRIANHFYSPLILSDVEKIDYIRHIINVDSEVQFIEELIKVENELKDVEWMFSKIDQTLDSKNIAMPYFSTKYNEYKNFFPDFMFWRRDGKDYHIFLVDPKGTEHSSYLSKADSYMSLFEENGVPRVFKYKQYNVYVHLKLVYDDSEHTIPALYEKYWISNNNFDWLIKK